MVTTAELVGGPQDGVRWVMPDDPDDPRPVISLEQARWQPGAAPDRQLRIVSLLYARDANPQPDGHWMYRYVPGRR